MHLAAVPEASAGRDAFRSVNRLYPFMCLVVVYCHSCLSDPSLEPDSLPVSFGETRVARALTTAVARASESAGSRASARAGASAGGVIAVLKVDAGARMHAAYMRAAMH